jgi:GNAT superfamily N-acetyltransferase
MTETSIKQSIKANWENYHYCLGRSPSVELSIGRYLTWLVTKMPDHFMNLVVCTELPSEGTDELIEGALGHFQSLKVRKLSWLAGEGEPSVEIRRCLVAHGLTFHESFATEMAVELDKVPGQLPRPPGLEIVPVEDERMLREWVHVATTGFDVPGRCEEVWYDLLAEAVFESRFRTYLAIVNGQPVGTSQLFLSAEVAGIYNVTCLPEKRGQGIGAAITQAPLLQAREMGYGTAILQASRLGYPVYRRLGFQDYGKLSLYLWDGEQGKSKG